jgi:hypothetical protein
MKETIPPVFDPGVQTQGTALLSAPQFGPPALAVEFVPAVLSGLAAVFAQAVLSALAVRFARAVRFGRAVVSARAVVFVHAVLFGREGRVRELGREP